QGIHVRNRFVVLEGDGAQAIARAFFDGHGDIDGFSQPALEPGNVEAFVSGVVDFGFGLVDQHFEVAAVLELSANALGIFFELGGVVGLGEEIFQKDGMRDADGLKVLHGRTQSAVIDMFIAPETNVSNFDLGPLFDDEGDADCCGRNGADFGADSGELTSVLGEQFFEHYFGSFDLGGIILVFHGESDLALFEAVEYVAGGDGIEAGVIDFADGGALFEVNVQNPALGTLLALEADVLKVAGIPERVEVAFDGGRVVDVARLGEDAGSDGIGGNAAIAVHDDADDEILLAKNGGGQERKREPSEEPIPAATPPPNSWGERRWRPGGRALPARVVAQRRAPRRDYLMTAMNCNYLEKLELGKR